MLPENISQSEWDPILTPSMQEYAWVRVVGKQLQIKLAPYEQFTLVMDAKAIPQLIKILSRLENKLE